MLRIRFIFYILNYLNYYIDDIFLHKLLKKDIFLHIVCCILCVFIYYLNNINKYLYKEYILFHIMIDTSYLY